MGPAGASRLPGLLAAVLSLALLSSCSSETYTAIVVEVTVNGDASMVSELQITAVGLSTGRMAAQATMEEQTFPQSLVVFPAESPDEPVRVTVEGKVDGAMARRVVTTRFEPDRVVTVSVALSSACAGVACGTNVDCNEGVCAEGPACESAAECDDGVACTLDTCSAAGACQHTPGAGCGEVVCAGCDKGGEILAPGERIAVELDGAALTEGSCGGAGAEQSFKIQLDERSDIFVTTHGSAVDTVIYLRSCSCDGPEVACNDDADGQITSRHTFANLEPGIYNLFIDTKSPVSASLSADVFITPRGLEGDRCGHPVFIPPATTVISGDTSNLSHDYLRFPTDDCPDFSVEFLPSMGNDMVFAFYLPAPATIQANGCDNSSYDMVTYVRSVCTDARASAQEGCNDDGPDCPSSPPGNDVNWCTEDFSLHSQLKDLMLPAGMHYLIVDGFNAEYCLGGAFEFSLSGL